MWDLELMSAERNDAEDEAFAEDVEKPLFPIDQPETSREKEDVDIRKIDRHTETLEHIVKVVGL